MKLTDRVPFFNEVDKQKHILVTSTITFVMFFINFILHVDIDYNIALAVSVSMSAGVVKEALDFYDHECFDWRDILADVIGTVMGLIIALAVIL